MAAKRKVVEQKKVGGKAVKTIVLPGQVKKPVQIKKDPKGGRGMGFW